MRWGTTTPWASSPTTSGGRAFWTKGSRASRRAGSSRRVEDARPTRASRRTCCCSIDRKSTRLNSSHANISYAVFCLKKKKKEIDPKKKTKKQNKNKKKQYTNTKHINVVQNN